MIHSAQNPFTMKAGVVKLNVETLVGVNIAILLYSHENADFKCVYKFAGYEERLHRCYDAYGNSIRAERDIK